MEVKLKRHDVGGGEVEVEGVSEAVGEGSLLTALYSYRNTSNALS